MANSESTQQHDLAENSQYQPAAQPQEHRDRDDVARQQGTIEDSVSALVELPAAVLAPAPTIALCCQVYSLGHSRQAADYAIHRNLAVSTAILGRLIPCCHLRRDGGGVTTRAVARRFGHDVIGNAVGVILLLTAAA